jgi:superfamily II DNA helicase RecQ
LELRDDFEVHNKIIENFGTRILHVLSAEQEDKQRQLPKARAVAVTACPARPTFGAQEQRGEGGAAAGKGEERTSWAKVGAAKKVAGGKVGTVYGSGVEARFERLRTLRLELARRNQWPAYCVLQDVTLLEIARSQPRTMRELLEIKGVGPKRAEKYGKELLAEVAKG